MTRLLAVLLLVAGVHASYAQNRIDVVNRALVANEDARLQPTYLASCALDENTVLQAVRDGEAFEFPNALGLASEWQDRPLTATERKWVSACFLARTSAFGANVLISMRSRRGFHAALNVSPEKLQSRTIYEGGFFGDIFADDAETCVCIGEGHAADIAARETRIRVCTHGLQDGAAGTRCGFISIGVCPQGAPAVATGKEWAEVIHVWHTVAEPPPD